jgi:hypothetical protein
MAREVGIEPTTNRLTADCSAAELLPNTGRIMPLQRYKAYHAVTKDDTPKAKCSLSELLAFGNRIFTSIFVLLLMDSRSAT